VHAVRVRGLPSAGAEVALPGGEPMAARLTRAPDGDAGDITVTLGGRTVSYAAAFAPSGSGDGETLWLGRDGAAWSLTRHLLGDPGDRTRGTLAGDGVARSPMPGTVLAVKVTAGERVTEGQPLAIVE